MVVVTGEKRTNHNADCEYAQYAYSIAHSHMQQNVHRCFFVFSFSMFGQFEDERLQKHESCSTSHSFWNVVNDKCHISSIMCMYSKSYRTFGHPFTLLPCLQSVHEPLFCQQKHTQKKRMKVCNSIMEIAQ